jgi:hypothetical protein
MRLETPYKIYPSGARNNSSKYGHLSIHLILFDIHTILGATAPTMGLSIDLTPAQHNYTKVGWVNEPDGRGTLSILVSCLSSLFLSSWAVMHLNVPRRRSSTTRRLGTYLYWCIYGIFGPELVIWTAWRQLLSAWALRNGLRKVSTSMSCTDRAAADFF